MSNNHLNIKEILLENRSNIFLVGSGCSTEPPSNLPLAAELCSELIKFFCAKSEIESILGMEGIFLENLLEIIRTQFDSQLQVLDFFETCDAPNSYSYFLTEMIRKGNFVLTTNYDYLIEQAFIKQGESSELICPIITEIDYKNTDKYFKEMEENGLHPIFKLHGSPKNIITHIDTRSYLLNFISKLGKNKTPNSLFRIEPFKGVFFNKIFNSKTVFVLGYSGLNDLDLVPILKSYNKFKRIIWFNHKPENLDVEVKEILKNHNGSDNESIDDLDMILKEIKNKNQTVEVYRANLNLSEFIKGILNPNKIIPSEPFNADLSNWLLKNIEIPEVADKYLISHIIYFNYQRTDDAFRCGMRFLDSIDESFDINKKLIVLNNIGWIYYTMGNYSEAINKYKQTAQICEEMGNTSQQIIYLNNLGEIYEKIKDFPQAIKIYKEVMILSEESNNLIEDERAIFSIIDIYEELENFSEAIKYYEKGLKIIDKIGDLKKKAIYLNNMASVYYKLDDLDSAMSLFLDADKLFTRLKDFMNLSACLSNIGMIFQKQKEYEFALDKFSEALEIDEGLKNESGKADHLYKIGTIHFEEGNYLEASNYFDHSLDIAKKLEFTELLFQNYNMKGKSQYFQKKYILALDSFDKGLELAEKLDNILMKADFLNNIAGCYYMQLDFEKALDNAEKSLANLKLYGLGKSIKAINLMNKIAKIKTQIKS